MAKRFTDTEKWTKNKWFRKLPNDLKIFWLFILDNCDCVGVWEEDIEFVCDLLGLKLKKESALNALSSQIQVIQSGRKWWIKNFCFYQYGELKEVNVKNKPHQKYISELKKHRLWIDYTETIHSPQEKEEEKEEEEEMEKEEESAPENHFDRWWGLYDKKRGRTDCQKKWSKIPAEEIEKIIEHTINYVKSTPDKTFRKDPETYLNGKHWNDEIIYTTNHNATNQFTQQTGKQSNVILTGDQHVELDRIANPDKYQ